MMLLTKIAGAAALTGLLAISGLLVSNHAVWAAEEAVVVPAPEIDPASTDPDLETAVLAGGCFWGVQAVFQHVKGVKSAVSGYAGGNAATAHYQIVSTGATGHAESVEVTYDPSEISYGTLLQVFFSVAHDPTQLNRQGPDTGTQYRSAIFFTTTAQEEVANAYIAQLDAAGVYSRPIVTDVDALEEFYPAEDYHQDYLVNHPNQPYIVYNDLPKIENLKRLFPSLYVEDPALVAEQSQ